MGHRITPNETKTEWLNLLERVQQALHVVCRLVLQDFYAPFHLRRNKPSEWEHRRIRCRIAVRAHAASFTASALLTSILEDLLKAPLGWTWSYRIMTPTITLMQNKSVSSLLKRLEYSLKTQKEGREMMKMIIAASAHNELFVSVQLN